MKKVTGMLIMALLCAGLLTFVGCKKSAELPAVFTSGISQVTPTTAATGGEILSSGDSYVTQRGVCWGTSPGPTIYYPKTVDGSGPGAFTSRLTGLDPETTYYVRAYATNAEGTAYGEEIIFTTGNFDYWTISDIDGNFYKTIHIGNQNWMAENLRVTKYNDGSSISNVTDYSEWSALETGAYCWYENNATKYKEDYGALYNYHAVKTNKLCPDGWHIPSEDEVSELATYLGGMEITGIKLNSVGFNALTSGVRQILPVDYAEYVSWLESEWAGKGFVTYWWTSPSNSRDYGVSWGVSYNSEYYVDYFFTDQSGLSVRCMED